MVNAAIALQIFNLMSRSVPPCFPTTLNSHIDEGLNFSGGLPTNFDWFLDGGVNLHQFWFFFLLILSPVPADILAWWSFFCIWLWLCERRVRSSEKSRVEIRFEFPLYTILPVCCCSPHDPVKVNNQEEEEWWQQTSLLNSCLTSRLSIHKYIFHIVSRSMRSNAFS